MIISASSLPAENYIGLLRTHKINKVDIAAAIVSGCITELRLFAEASWQWDFPNNFAYFGMHCKVLLLTLRKTANEALKGCFLQHKRQ